jgi:hypothetical protein
MRPRRSPSRSTRTARGVALLYALALVAGAAGAHAQTHLAYAGKAVHPACVHALAMHQGDAVPVTTAVSVEGCASSERSASAVRVEDEFYVFEDDAVLGGGSFGYRELTQLDNGIIGLVVRRVLPDGAERVSLAAVLTATRPMIRNGHIIQVEQIELLGELWIPDMQVMSFRSMGNTVRFSAGSGPDKVEREVDFTRLGRMRRK